MKNMRFLSLVAASAALAGCQAYEVDPVRPAAAKVETHTEVTATQLSPNVVFVVDHSGSMQDVAGQGQSQSKWQDLVQVMTQDDGNGVGFVADLAQRGTATDPVRLGLVTFPSDNVCGNGTQQVPPDPNNANAVSQIDQVLANPSYAPAGGTPTASSMVVAAQSFQNVGGGGRPNYIVLMTDGAPNCNPGWDQIQGNTTDKCQDGSEYCALGACCYSGQVPQSASGCNAPQGCLDSVNLVNTINTIKQNSIGTFVIGFGEDVSNPSSLAYATLDQSAAAGGHPQAGEPQFYVATSQADLANALKAILNVIAASCQYPLDATPPSPSAVEVVVTPSNAPAQTLVLNTDYTVSGNTVTINDPWCQQITTATADNPVSVTFNFLGQ